MSVKQIAKSFYDCDLAKENQAISFIHSDCQLNWHSSKGFTILNRDKIESLLAEIRRSYVTFRYEMSHLLQDKNTVTVRYTIHAASIERPTKVEPLAHFITIWETKDGKLYKGFEISQLSDDSTGSINSFNPKS